MNSDWIKIYTHTMDFRAELVRLALESHGITAVVITKKDHSYNNFGESEVYVHKNNNKEALKILDNEIRFE